ncbi:MAG: serine hydrolase [Lachnospiraceae bacterium]|nr:serine hydrolase [Lachnospiraceae bacterium]
MSKTVEKSIAAMKERVDGMLKMWNLPGVSVALVKDGEMVYCSGFGARDVAGSLGMDGETHLPIGSITKSFTSLALGILADEGKLDWDAPVITYIPWLKLSNPEVQNQVTARDLMSHRTGMAKYDAHAVFCTKDDRKEMVEDLQYMQINAPFRSMLQYSNQMVMLAGYLVEVLSGKSWEDFVQEKIIAPLGMTETSFKAEDLPGVENASKGYVFTGTDFMETMYLPLRGVAPAGGIVSTAKDMAKYTAFQLGDGTVNGQRIISKEQLDQCHTPQMDGTPYFWQLEEVTECKYGLGWFTDKYRGKAMISHGGNTLGFSSLLTLLPEENFGIVLLSNATSNFMIYPLTYMILDDVLGLDDCGWNEKFQATIGAIFAAMAEGQKAMAEAQVQGTTPSRPAEEYAGKFTAPAFGTLELQAGEGSYMGTLNGFAAMMNHYQYDDFQLVLPLMGLMLPAKYVFGEDGAVCGIAIVFEPTPGVEPVIFTKE